MKDQILRSHFFNRISSTEMNYGVSKEYHMYDLTSAITVPLFTSNNSPCYFLHLANLSAAIAFLTLHL